MIDVARLWDGGVPSNILMFSLDGIRMSLQKHRVTGMAVTGRAYIDSRLERRAWVFMKTSRHGNVFRLTGPLWGGIHRWRWIPPHKWSVIRNCDVFFTVSVNELLNKQSSCRWFETTWHWCSCRSFWNDVIGSTEIVGNHRQSENLGRWYG